MRIARDVEAELWRGGRESDLGMGGKGGVGSSYNVGVKSNSGSQVSPGPFKGTPGSGPVSSAPFGDRTRKSSFTNVHTSVGTNSVRPGREEGSRTNTS